jgi:hypothetical protein
MKIFLLTSTGFEAVEPEQLQEFIFNRLQLANIFAQGFAVGHDDDCYRGRSHSEESVSDQSKSDLARALLNVGFEYREEGRFDKRGQNFGAARKTLSSNIDFRTLYGEENSKMLKPQREFYSNSRDAIFVFESQETSPTWSDDTKVDVFVYMAPQVDEVVKGLLKKKP